MRSALEKALDRKGLRDILKTLLEYFKIFLTFKDYLI